MPSATEYINPQDPNGRDAIALENEQRRELDERLLVINKNWEYYKGKMRQPLKNDKTGVDDNVRFPLVQNIVDKGVAGMLGNDDVGIVEGIVFLVLSDETPRFSRRTNTEFLAALRNMVRSVTGEDELTQAQRYIDATWQANNKGALLHNIFLLLSITGHIFIKILPNYYDGKLARFLPLDTRHVTVFWKEDDPETVLWYRYEFGRERFRIRQDFVQEADGTWHNYEYREGKDHAGWLLGVDEKWDLAVPPMIDWQNLPLPVASGQYYGRDDIGILTDLNDSVNFIASNMQRIQKHHAHPKTIVTGAEAKDIQTEINTLYAIGSEKAEVYNLEMKSDMSSSLNFLRAVEHAIYAYGREVDPVALVEKFGDRLTNFAVRVIHGDTLAKRQAKWMVTEAALARLQRGLLSLGGFSDSLRVDTIPPDPLPTDQFQQAETLTMDVGKLGLSQITALERRGYDPATEMERRELNDNTGEDDDRRNGDSGRDSEDSGRDSGNEGTAGE